MICRGFRTRVSSTTTTPIKTTIHLKMRHRRRHVSTLLLLCELLTLSIAAPNPIYLPQYFATGSGRSIRHLPCISHKTRETGVCMFAFACAKANGTHLGTCIDRFYFGSCCKINDEPDILPMDNTIDEGISKEPFVTTHSSSIESNDIPQLLDKPRPSSTSEPKKPSVMISSSTTSVWRTPTTAKPHKVVTKRPTTPKPSTTTESLALSTFQTVQSAYDEQTIVPSLPTRPSTPIKVAITTSTTLLTSSTFNQKQTTTSQRRPTTPATSSTTVTTTTTTAAPRRPITTTQRTTIGTRFPPRNTTKVKPTTSQTTLTSRPLPTKTTTSTSKVPLTTVTEKIKVKLTTPPSSTTTTARPTKPSFTKPFSSSSSSQKFTTTTSSTPTTVTKNKITKPPTKPFTKPYTTQTSTRTTTTSTTQAPVTTVRTKITETAATTRPYTRPTHASSYIPKITTTSTTTTTSTSAPPTTKIKLKEPPPRPSTRPTTLLTSTSTTSTTSTTTTTTTPRPSSLTTPSTTLKTTTTTQKATVPTLANDILPPKEPVLEETTTESLGLVTWTSSIDDTTTKYYEITTTTPEATTEEYTTTRPTAAPTLLSTIATVTVNPDLPISVDSLNMSDYKQVCGRRMFPQARIVGGDRSSFAKWPWQISLRQWKTSTYLHKCGAALLSENWAITAAHCVENQTPSDLLLRIGEHDLGNEDEPYNYVERRVQIVATHPQFDPRTYEYDLALLRFYEPLVPFQPNVVPICLPFDDDSFVGQTAYVTGWGRLYEDGPLPSVLQEVAVPVINNSVCEAMYKNAGYVEHIPYIFICAGWRKGRFDSCEGDSGGPLVIQRPSDKRWVLAGIISWGIGCAEPNQPGVYTRISEFRDWINQILQF